MAVKTVKKKAPKKKTAATKKSSAKKKTANKNVAAIYDEYKVFNGQQYTGMKIGRSHKWYYDKGEWKEKKITPDLWEISYAVTKRRAGKAPEGSGVPVGTEYHWYILAHQVVKKLNANDYTTELSGIKFKLAHKRVDKNKWSATARTQRKRLVKLMQEMIAQLEMEPIPLEFEYKGTEYSGEGIPVLRTCSDDLCFELEITLNNEYIGILHSNKSGWKMDTVEDKGLIKAIGEEVHLWYDEA